MPEEGAEVPQLLNTAGFGEWFDSSWTSVEGLHLLQLRSDTPPDVADAVQRLLGPQVILQFGDSGYGWYANGS